MAFCYFTENVVILLEPSIEFSFFIVFLFIFSGFSEWFSFMAVVVKVT